MAARFGSILPRRAEQNILPPKSIIWQAVVRACCVGGAEGSNVVAMATALVLIVLNLFMIFPLNSRCRSATLLSAI